MAGKLKPKPITENDKDLAAPIKEQNANIIQGELESWKNMTKRLKVDLERAQAEIRDLKEKLRVIQLEKAETEKQRRRKTFQKEQFNFILDKAVEDGKYSFDHYAGLILDAGEFDELKKELNLAYTEARRCIAKQLIKQGVDMRDSLVHADKIATEKINELLK